MFKEARDDGADLRRTMKKSQRGLGVRKRNISRGWNTTYFFLLGVSRSFEK